MKALHAVDSVRGVVSVLFVLAVTGPALGDSWERFRTRRYISPNQAYEAFITESGKITVFEVSDRCTPVWNTKMPELPRSAFLSDDGMVLALVDTYGGNEAASPGLRLLRNGQLLRQHRIGDLIDVSRAERSISSTWWYEEQGTGFASRGKHFFIRSKPGGLIAFALRDGMRVKKPFLQRSVLQPGTSSEADGGKRGSVSPGQLFNNCALSTNTAPLVKGLAGEIHVEPACAVHLARHHPDNLIPFELSGGFRYLDRDFLLSAIEMQIRDGTLLSKLKMRTFEVQTKILLEELDALLDAEMGLEGPIRVRGYTPEYEVTFRWSGPDLPYLASMRCDVKDGILTWTSLTPAEARTFISRVEQEGLEPLIPDYCRRPPGIRISVAGSSYRGKDDRTLSIGSAIRYRIAEDHFTKPASP